MKRVRHCFAVDPKDDPDAIENYAASAAFQAAMRHLENGARMECIYSLAEQP